MAKINNRLSESDLRAAKRRRALDRRHNKALRKARIHRYRTLLSVIGIVFITGNVVGQVSSGEIMVVHREPPPTEVELKNFDQAFSTQVKPCTDIAGRMKTRGSLMLEQRKVLPSDLSLEFTGTIRLELPAGSKNIRTIIYQTKRC